MSKELKECRVEFRVVDNDTNDVYASIAYKFIHIRDKKDAINIAEKAKYMVEALLIAMDYI